MLIFHITSTPVFSSLRRKSGIFTETISYILHFEAGGNNLFFPNGIYPAKSPPQPPYQNITILEEGFGMSQRDRRCFHALMLVRLCLKESAALMNPSNRG
jgi:hypothetical protein